MVVVTGAGLVCGCGRNGAHSCGLAWTACARSPHLASWRISTIVSKCCTVGGEKVFLQKESLCWSSWLLLAGYGIAFTHPLCFKSTCSLMPDKAKKIEKTFCGSFSHKRWYLISVTRDHICWSLGVKSVLKLYKITSSNIQNLKKKLVKLKGPDFSCCNGGGTVVKAGVYWDVRAVRVCTCGLH